MSITVVAVGDIMLGVHPLNVTRGVRPSKYGNEEGHPPRELLKRISDKDIMFGNLEAVLSDIGYDEKRFRSVVMRGRPEKAKLLAIIGFDVLSVANNHTLDHGANAARDTMRNLEDNEIRCVGLDSNLHQDHTPLVIVRKGVKIAFLAYCLIPSAHSNLIVTNEDRICEDVSLAKVDSDFVIVSLHWGDEYMITPSPSQIDLAHRIIDSGACLILGHHPHVLQGIERYNDGVIAYSLGNFMFDMEFAEESKDGMILTCILSRKGAVEYEIVPITADGCRIPRIPVGCERDSALSRRGSLSSQLERRESRELHIKQTDYSREALLAGKRSKRRAKIHFMKNLPKYGPRFSTRIIFDYFMSRLRR